MNQVTGKRPPGETYAPSTIAHCETVLRSLDARGGNGLRGCGNAQANAAFTVRRLTLYLPASARPDKPSRAWRRIAANRSIFDKGGIGTAFPRTSRCSHRRRWRRN
jgi:hypothetical protein